MKLAGLVRTRAGALGGVFLFVPAVEAMLFFALDPKGKDLVAAGIAAAWLAISFAALWLVEELVRDEWASGAIEVYLVAGAPEHFFWEWTIIGAVFVTLLGTTAFLTAAMLFGVPFAPHAGALIGLSALFGGATSGLIVLTRQLAHGAGAGGFLAPLLLFPLMTPVLLGCVQAARAAVLTGQGAMNWVLLSAFFGILYLLLGSWVVPSLMKE